MIRFGLVLFAFLAVRYEIFCHGADINLSFIDFSSSRNDHVDVETVLPAYTMVKVIVQDMPTDSIDFIIIQAHSYLHSVTLSFGPLLMAENHVNGTNVGLYYRNHGPAVLYLKNPHNVNVTVMVAAVPYSNESPIPGGCNLEAPLPIKPYLSLEVSDAMVVVDGSPASNLNSYDNCDVNLFAYIMFYKYTPERDFSVDTYFNAIRSMLTYPRILNSSYVAPEPTQVSALRRIFNKYSGIGTVYSLIAFNKFGNVAVYTPTFSYACDSPFGDMPCELMSSPLLKIQFAILISVSALICFAGHRYFSGELFFMGAVAGGLHAYILLLLQSSLTIDLLLMSTGIGIVSGAVWMSLWYIIGSPILSVALPFLVNGFLTSAVVLFYFMYGFTLLQNDMNYWLTFFVFLMVTFLVSTTHPVKCNMLACSFVGAFGILLPLDYYIGSSLKYIVINVIRRATVEGFNLASTKPPFQIADCILCVMWISLVIGGYFSQKKLSANRPPFPPVCLILREPIPETLPILSNARFPSYT